jgi:hypothetical protein
VFIRGHSLHFFFVSWWLCGYEVIMQNKANLQKAKNEIKPLYNK